MSTATEIRPPETSFSLAERFANVLTAAMLIAGVCVFGLRNLRNTNLWADEASSLWTALGWPAPGEMAGSFSRAWQDTLSTHVEPGLFNVIERYWALVFGTDIVTLRLLPFVFFLAYIASLVFLGRIIVLPWFVAIAASSLLLLENITPYYAVELRPYSAGLAASVAVPILAIWLALKVSPQRLFIFLLSLMVLGTMQYGSVPVLLGVAAFLVYSVRGATGLGERRLLLVGAATAALWQPVVFLVTRGNPLMAVTSDVVPYPEIFFTNMQWSEVLRIIGINLFSLTALPRTVFLLLIPILWVSGRLVGPFRERSCSFGQAINGLWLVILVATGSSALLAFWGVMPWVLGTRWSIAEVGLIAMSVLGLMGLLMHALHRRRLAVQRIVIVGALLITAVGSFRLATYERPLGVEWRPALEVMLSGQTGGTIVDMWIYPEIKYWVELSGDYPQFTQAWLAHEVQPSAGESRADAQTISDFLTSDADRLLLRNQQVLEGVTVPEDVEIIVLDRDDAGVARGPVLIVK